MSLDAGACGEDSRQQALLAEVKEFAGYAAALTQQMNWIAWMAIKTPGEVRRRHFDDDDSLAKSTLEHLMASVAVVGLLDPTVHERLTEVQLNIEGADLVMGRAGDRFRHDDAAWRAMLRTAYPQLLDVYRSIGATLRDISTQQTMRGATSYPPNPPIRP